MNLNRRTLLTTSAIAVAVVASGGASAAKGRFEITLSEAEWKANEGKWLPCRKGSLRPGKTPRA